MHHGLSPNADRWLAHCADRCRRWARGGKAVEFVAHRVATKPEPGDSIEAWARRARYRALRAMALERGIDLVMLAHHRRDQTETFVLQALRGGGVAALAAMPAIIRRDGVTWARPWLESPRESIDAYARRHRLRWIEDESNDDVRFARNRLRRDVWPALIASFGDAEAALASAAREAARAAALIDDVAADDLASIAGDDGLDLVAWRALSAGRQWATLRHWLRRVLGSGAPASLVERLMDEARADGAQRWPAAGGELRSYRGRLAFARSTTRQAGTSSAGAAVSIGGEPDAVDLSRAGIHAFAHWGGALRVEVVASGGIDVARAARLTLRARRPGDRFQAGPGRPVRSLKLQFQAAAIAAAGRAAPVVCDGATLVFVAGLGIDARVRASPGDAQVMLHWLPSVAVTDEGAG